MLLNHANSQQDGAFTGRANSAGMPLIHETMENELERLREREREMVELLDAKSPDRLIHDLRNVLNELQLLRMLADDKV